MAQPTRRTIARLPLPGRRGPLDAAAPRLLPHPRGAGDDGLAVRLRVDAKVRRSPVSADQPGLGRSPKRPLIHPWRDRRRR
jgi:hypothetical protein